MIEEPQKVFKLKLKRPDGRVEEVVPSVIVAGMDFGFTDPFVIEVGAKIGSCWVNIHEVYRVRAGIPDILKETVRVCREFGLDRIWADSEDPQMITYLQSHNLPVHGNQFKDVIYGIQTVYSLMKQVVDHPILGKGPKFRVDKRQCPQLVREASQYGHAVVRGEVRTGRPIDKHNHAWDTVRYYITNEGEMPPDLYTPEQKRRRFGMYVDEQGKWKDDPIGYQIGKAKQNRVEPDEWWDEKMGAMIDNDDIISVDEEWT